MLKKRTQFVHRFTGPSKGSQRLGCSGLHQGRSGCPRAFWTVQLLSPRRYVPPQGETTWELRLASTAGVTQGILEVGVALVGGDWSDANVIVRYDYQGTAVCVQGVFVVVRDVLVVLRLGREESNDARASDAFRFSPSP